MTGYIAGFSGMFSSGEGGTRDIAERIPGAAHYASVFGTSDWQEVAQEITKLHLGDKLPRPLCLFGHSNGGYSVLKIAQTLDAQGIEVDYLGIIDLTLKPSPPVYGNVKLFQEFHSAYAKTKLADDFSGKHEFYDLDKVMNDNIGHSEAATLEFTQNKIVETIEQLRKGSKPMSKIPVELNKMVIAAGEAIDPAKETPEQTKFNKVFFDAIRPLFNPISPGALDGMKMIIHAFDIYIAPKGYDDRLLAFVLGNVFNETGKRMQPVRETNAKTHQQAMARLDKWWNSGKAQKAGVRSRYWKNGYYGRGLFQETHFGNYSKGGVLWEKWFQFPLDFVANPDLFLNPIVSALSAFIGSIEGKYTSKKFEEFCSGDSCDYAAARSMVNGDRRIRLRDVDGDGVVELMGDEIGDVCEAFEKALTKARMAATNLPAPIDPELIETPVIVPEGGLDDARASLERYFPTLNEQNRELVLALAMVLGRPPDKPPINTQIEFQPDPPRAGFSLPHSIAKGNDMTGIKGFFQSKTIRGIGTALFGSLLPTIAPMFGFDFTANDGQEVLDNVSRLLEILGSLYAIYGRVVAKDVIKFGG